MARSNILFDSGDKREGKTRVRGAKDDAPRYDTLDAYPGESLASITTRAYGANTERNREKIRQANNADLRGTIRVPR